MRADKWRKDRVRRGDLVKRISYPTMDIVNRPLMEVLNVDMGLDSWPEHKLVRVRVLETGDEKDLEMGLLRIIVKHSDHLTCEVWKEEIRNGRR